MKANFSHILIPKGTMNSNSNINNSTDSTSSNSLLSFSQDSSKITKWLLITTLAFTLGVALFTSLFVVRYEDKLVQYEERIFALETDLEELARSLNSADEIVEYETHAIRSGGLGHEDLVDSGEDEEDLVEIYEEDDLGNISLGDELPVEEEREVVRDLGSEFGKVELHEKEEKETLSRRKRQIAFPQVPTFGPEVERTKDGVPIVEQSYLSSVGVTLNPRQRSQYQQTTDPDGLRLYDALDYTGGRNEHRTSNQGHHRREHLQPLLPHHQVSAAWSERSESQYGQGQRQRLELKSADFSTSVHSTDSDLFHPEGTYSRTERRSAQGTTGTNGGTLAGSTASYQSGSNTNSNSNSNTFGTGSNGATYHRNSRVPATETYYYPTKSSTQTRSAQYPPLRKLSVGDGEGEVIARVLQNDNEDLDSNGPNLASASANLGQGNSEASSQRHRTGYKRQQRTQTQQHPNQNLNQNQQQGQSGAPVVTSHAQTHSFRGGERQRFNRKNSEEDSGEMSIVRAEAWVEGPKPIVAHYVADVSNYTTAHRHYDGNGRLRNADGIFEAWRPADWMVDSGNGSGTKNFVLSPMGVLTVKKAGLYYIYAQIHYLDEHDINGFTVQLNTSPFLQCTTMTETYTNGSKSNSCFTAGVNYLKEEDRIIIKDIETNRYSIFKPEKSFFGLMRIGDFN